jgi:hypothetical protein
MTGGGVWHGDMPIFPWPAPGDVPAVGDPAFEALLAGSLLPEDAAGGLYTAAEVIAGLTGAPTLSELAAEASALAVFRSVAGVSAESTRSRPRRHPLLASLLSAKAAAAVAAAAVTLGGGAVAAAYTGVLPASMQKLAHDTIGAPQATHSASPAPSGSPVGPDATGHAAYGLCTAYAHLKAHGSAKQKAVAFRNLVTAAGGAANVTAYCAGVAHPGSAQSAGHPTGKPSTLPSQAPTSHPTGKPTSHPTGLPTGHPTGRPTSTP